MSCNGRPFGDLESYALDWLKLPPRRLELCAALKDFQGLYDLAPTNPANIANIGGGVIPRLCPLAELVSDMKGTLKDILKHTRRNLKVVMPVISPYLGGIDAAELDSSSADKGRECSQLKLAVFNPGRTGLIALSTEEILWWRLGHISCVLLEQDVQICVLPGARWPPEASLPPGKAYAWLGAQTTSWRSVGMLVATELVSQVAVLDDIGSDVILWVAVHEASDVSGSPRVIIGGIYPAPGGDTETWAQVIKEFQILEARYPLVPIIIAGDANVHLTYLAQHDAGCRCLHCRQTVADRYIEQLLLTAGLLAHNPLCPTHTSGTVIDLVLSRSSTRLSASVLQEDVGNSDHFMVLASCEVQLKVALGPSVGRVSWSQSDLWDSILVEAKVCQQLMTKAIVMATEEMTEAMPLPVKRRRSVLESAAWMRETFFCILAHCKGLVVALSAKSNFLKQQAGPHKWPKPAEFETYDDYKAALASMTAKAKYHSFQKYLALRASDPNQAKQFISSFFKKNKAFEIALTHEDSGHLMSVQGMLAAIDQDLQSRADNNFEQDTVVCENMQHALREVKQAGAPATGVVSCPVLASYTTASNRALYDLAELNSALSFVKPKKKSINHPLSTVKAQCVESRLFLLALVNLGRAVELTASFWSTRHICPLRKSGPKVVRKLNNLRPISQSSDIAAVQDSLWLQRCRFFLEAGTGLMQMGGKFDVMAVVLAIILHIQIRHCQGLNTYLLFADLKWAFDTADQTGILLACYSMGIVETEWRLLEDFFFMDSARVNLGGVLSKLLTFRAGIPQGRRFGVHTFTSLMTMLQQVLLSTTTPANTILPSFAAEAISGLWEHLTPMPFEAPIPNHFSPHNVAAVVKENANRCNSDVELRRLAMHLVGKLATHGDRVRCLELLGYFPVTPLMYVDDLVAAYASASDACSAATVGLTTYATSFKASFNMGPTKAAIMPCFDAEDIPLPHLQCSKYKLLGVLLEKDFSFTNKVRCLIKVGNALFDELVHALTLAGFPPPCIALAVTERIDPVILFGCEVLILAEGAYNQINAMQARWAKRLLIERTYEHPLL